MSGGGSGQRAAGSPGYLDFEVEVGAGSGRAYPLEVRSPAGEARATLRFPFDEAALENRLLTLQNALLRGVALHRQLPEPAARPVEAFGGALFEALLSGEARARYDLSRRIAREQGKGLRLRLRLLDPGLAALPWEFLYDARRGDYVCLSQDTPVVRYLELPEPCEPLAVAPPLRILGMVASPRDLPALDTGGERERMEHALGDLRAQGLVELVWLEGQTWGDLQEALWPRRGPWHVFHFVGHGGVDPQTGEGHLALAAEEGGGTYRLSATSLGRLLDDHRPLRLAVLNACEGARGDGRDVVSGTAATLVRAGLPAVVAMQYPITDPAAVQFARAFYRALGAALPVDAAVGAARQAMRLAAPASAEWGTPVLYLRAPDAVLFDLPPAVQAGDPGPRPAAPAPAAPAGQPPAPPAPGRRGPGASWWLWLGAGVAAALLLIIGAARFMGPRLGPPGVPPQATAVAAPAVLLALATPAPAVLLATTVAAPAVLLASATPALAAASAAPAPAVLLASATAEVPALGGTPAQASVGTSPRPACIATGATVTDYAGRRLGTYHCTTYAGSPVYANVQSGPTGPLDDSGYMDRADRVWVVCQYEGRANPVIDGNTNTWWLYTQGDAVRPNGYGYAAGWGYLPATAVEQGGQNEKVPGVPQCPRYY